MRILRAYLLREHAHPFLLWMLAFTFALFIGNLFKLADLVVNKGVPLAIVGQLFLYILPYLLSFTIPMAALMSTLLALGRLGQDNELTAIEASGISFWQLTVPVVATALLMSLGLILFNDQVLPRSHLAARRVVKELGLRNPAMLLEPGMFIKDFAPYILFFYGAEAGRLLKVRIYEPQPDRPARTIVAERGDILPLTEDGLIRLKLMDGSSDDVDPTNPERTYKVSFKTYFLALDLSQRNQRVVSKKPKEMTLQELRVEAAGFALQGIDPMPLWVEYHARWAFAFSPLVLVCVGLPLALFMKRGEWFVGLGLSLVVFVAYYLLSLGCSALALRNVLHPGLAMWAPNLLFLVSGAVGLVKAIEG